MLVSGCGKENTVWYLIKHIKINMLPSVHGRDVLKVDIFISLFGFITLNRSPPEEWFYTAQKYLVSGVHVNIL